jgi:hypothetical protein
VALIINHGTHTPGLCLQGMRAVSMIRIPSCLCRLPNALTSFLQCAAACVQVRMHAIKICWDNKLSKGCFQNGSCVLQVGGKDSQSLMGCGEQDFRKISGFLPHRTTWECVQHFYRIQKLDEFAAVRRKQQLKKRRQQSEFNRSTTYMGMHSVVRMPDPPPPARGGLCKWTDHMRILMHHSRHHALFLFPVLSLPPLPPVTLGRGLDWALYFVLQVQTYAAMRLFA